MQRLEVSDRLNIRPKTVFVRISVQINTKPRIVSLLISFLYSVTLRHNAG